MSRSLVQVQKELLTLFQTEPFWNLEPFKKYILRIAKLSLNYKLTEITNLLVTFLLYYRCCVYYDFCLYNLLFILESPFGQINYCGMLYNVLVKNYPETLKIIIIIQN